MTTSAWAAYSASQNGATSGSPPSTPELASGRCQIASVQVAFDAARSFASQRPWSLSAVQPPTSAQAESRTTMCHQPRSYEYQVAPSGAAAAPKYPR